MIYYTTDGTDPRASGGAAAGTACTVPIPIGETTNVTARALSNGAWSGPLTGSFIFGQAAGEENLVVSEIMYHPAPPDPREINAGLTDSELFEYLELLNIGPETIDLTGVTVGHAFDFAFTGASITKLAPGARILLVRNRAAFETRYGVNLPIAGVYGNPQEPGGGAKLDNGGERVVITASNGAAIKDFYYDDTEPWPTHPDGMGASLILVQPAENPPHGTPQSWRSSTGNGSPGSSGGIPFSGDPNRDGNQNGWSGFLEYALGIDADTPASIASAYGASGGGDGLTFRFQINLSAENIDYTVEASADLIDWQRDPARILYLGEENVANGSATRVYRILPAAGRFVRLRVTSPLP